MKNHPFVDGNNRVRLTCSLAFLRLNGIRIRATDDELVDVVVSVPEGRRWETPDRREERETPDRTQQESGKRGEEPDEPCRAARDARLHIHVWCYMFLYIRTTIELNDEIFRRAKQRAADEGVPLRYIVETALRDHLARRRSPARKSGPRRVHHRSSDRTRRKGAADRG
ncbi:MAG: hypothetical protein ACE5I7_13775 [Candidatus Binatia bacterium]